MSRSSVVPMLLLSILASGGCNVDRLFSFRQDRDAPMTNFDRPAGVDVPDIVVLHGNEVDLVEQVAGNRAVYKRSLEALREFYKRRGSYNKQQWAETELKELSHVKPFKYILSAEVPAKSLTASRSIAEADRMYDEGSDLMRRGGHGVPGFFRRDYMNDALDVFTQMIAQYPNSDKIDDAAFSCGEILKEYYQNQELLALKWYERAHEWDPQTPHPVLFQSAVVYDYRLHDRAKALELYHRVLKEETNNRSNTTFASNRIHSLTSGDGAVADFNPPDWDAQNSASRAKYSQPRRSPGHRQFVPRSRDSQGWQTGQSNDGVARSGGHNSARSSYDRYPQNESVDREYSSSYDSTTTYDDDSVTRVEPK